MVQLVVSWSRMLACQAKVLPRWWRRHSGSRLCAEVFPFGHGWWWSRSQRSAGTVQEGNRQVPARTLIAWASLVEGDRPSSVVSISRPPSSVSSRVNNTSSGLSDWSASVISSGKTAPGIRPDRSVSSPGASLRPSRLDSGTTTPIRICRGCLPTGGGHLVAHRAKILRLFPDHTFILPATTDKIERLSDTGGKPLTVDREVDDRWSRSGAGLTYSVSRLGRQMLGVAGNRPAVSEAAANRDEFQICRRRVQGDLEPAEGVAVERERLSVSGEAVLPNALAAGAHDVLSDAC